MLWEGKPLRDLREQDIRAVIDSGLEEHLQLEYKSALYDESVRGRKELLQDIAMFANTSGGLILIGVPERRDEGGQPTGVPDQDGVLGIEVDNPEALLATYDARVMDSIEERLPLESATVDVGGGRRIVVIRVPNSTRKPHSVRHEGHIYFPSRRERQRYPMTVREIKELAMRTASSLEQAKSALQEAMWGVTRRANSPYLIMAMIPVFFDEFMVDVRAEAVRLAVGNFSRGDGGMYRNPNYSFHGLERREDQFDHVVSFRRSGLLCASAQLPLLGPEAARAEEGDVFPMTGIDLSLRQFILGARRVYEAAGISGPYVMGMVLRVQRPLTGSYAGDGNLRYNAEQIPTNDYRFPFVEIDDLGAVDSIIRPLCDQAHQMFGREGSPSFGTAGEWIGR